MKSTIAAILISICFVFACSTTGVPTEFANACDAGNDKKTLEVSGILQSRGAILCSNYGGRMECPFELVEAAGSEKKITADIEVGEGKNSVTEIPKGFKNADLKVRDNAGNQIALGTDKIRLTGRMMVTPAGPSGQGVCVMQVSKIER